MTYTLDFRRKILSVQKEKNLALKETAERFQIGIATVLGGINESKQNHQTHPLL